MPLLGDAAALDSLRRRAVEEGYNMLALEYKDIRGTVVNESILSAAMEILNDPSLSLSAVIAAGADSTVPFGPNSAWAVKHISGVNFKDHLERRWLNLYLPEVRAFITGHVLNAFEAGFDRVLLTHVGFPYAGGNNQINFNGDDVTLGAVGAVNKLLEELAEAADGRPLDAWIFEGTAAEGLLEAAGQDLTAFINTFDLVYAVIPEDEIAIDTPLLPIIHTSSAYKTEYADQGFMLHNEQGRYFD
jgi:hypothetical protein